MKTRIASLLVPAVVLWMMLAPPAAALQPGTRPHPIRIRGMAGVPQAQALCIRQPHATFLLTLRGFYYPIRESTGSPNAGDGELFAINRGPPHPPPRTGQSIPEYWAQYGGLHVLLGRPVIKRFGRPMNGAWIHVRGTLVCGLRPSTLLASSWWRPVSPGPHP